VKIELDYALPPSNCGWQDEGSTEQNYVPCETYQITDVLPSGLSVVTSTGYGTFEGSSCYDFPAQVADQRVSFYVSQYTETACRNGLTYYARVVTPGTYLAEPAYIRSSRDPDMNNHSDAVTVTVNP